MVTNIWYSQSENDILDAMYFFKKSVIFRVIHRPVYASIAFASFIFLFVCVNLIPNMHTLFAVYASTGLGGAWNVAWSLLGWLEANSTPANYALTVTTLFCTAILIALVTYAIRRKQFMLYQAGTSTLGMISALFGVGCLSCGSVVLSLFLPAAGITLLRKFLPFHGAEFGALGLLLVTLSLFLVIKDIDRPAVCTNVSD